jgi:uncharacterized membrane protein
MSKFEKALKDWAAQGLITEEQASRIRAYEDTKPEGSWILYGLYLLGASVIAIGLISLIAANWDAIPGVVKLALDFILLGGLAFALVKTRDFEKPVVFEALLLFFMFMCLATIGLISQVYNTGGELYQALLLWSVITSGAMLTARTYLTPFLWVPAFVGSVLFACFEYRFSFFGSHEAILFPVPLFLALSSIVSSSLTGESAITRACRSWALISGLMGLIFAEVILRDQGEKWYEWMNGYGIAYVFAVLCSIAIYLAKPYSRVQKASLFSALVFYVIAFHLRALRVTEIMSAVVTLLALSSLAIFFAGSRSPRLFQTLLALIGLRFLIVYFEAIGGLALTGFGLMLSGVVVIAVGYLWNRYRVQMANWAERWAK